MPQLEIIPQGWIHIPTKKKYSLTLKSLDSRSSPCYFTFEIISASLFRITFTSSEHPLPPYPSCTVPKSEVDNVEIEVLDITEHSRKVFMLGKSLVISICWQNTPEISISRKTGGVIAAPPLYSDLQFRSYAIDGPGVAHYTTYDPKKHHAGLGEKAAPFDLSGRTFRIAATDSFGYNGHRTDPLYKHIPLLISAGPQGCVAQFSSSHSRSMVSVGGEMDGLWGNYKVYRQDYGGLEEYLMVGHTLQDITQTYAGLVGKPRLVPRWALGYIAGGMKYSMLDDPPAEDALMQFAERMRKEDIPCSAFQLSSGYTVAETEPKTRNVFTWNKHRFPNPERFLNNFKKLGIRVIANVKPYVLKNHPEYSSLESQDALFRSPGAKETAVTRLWSAGGGESGVGSHLDYTSQAAYQWWYRGVRELLKAGVAGVWNDNNEYTLPHDNWECKLDRKDFHTHHLGEEKSCDHSVGRWGRAIHTELMAKSSFEASVDECPNTRPYVLTRSATAGTMRYAASSWSGDNVTSWASMKAGNAMSLNAGLSLLTCYGHDIGGFEGAQPSPELLVRWVTMGIYSPRFAINCFKTSQEDNKVGDVIEPWMYPDVTSIIRQAIKRRYELLPFLYSLTIESHLFATPPQRWVGWGCENDSVVWANAELREGERQYWLGNSLMIGGVFEPGQASTRFYLPKGRNDDLGFVHLDPDKKFHHFSAGQWVTVQSYWRDGTSIFAKLGSAIPIGRRENCLSPGETENPANLPLDDYRGIEIYPPAGDHGDRKFGSTWYEDDGFTEGCPISRFSLHYYCRKDHIVVSFEKDCPPNEKRYWSELYILVPSTDSRIIYDGNGRKLWSEGPTIAGLSRYVLQLAEV